jgi:hypothetical protein
MATVTVDDYRDFGPGASMVDLSDAVVGFYLQGAEDLAASYIGQRGYDTLTTTGNDYKGAVFKIATWDLLVNVRGVNPADPAHAAVKVSRDEAVAWLRDVAKGVANLVGALPVRTSAGMASVFSVDTTTTPETTEGF